MEKIKLKVQDQAALTQLEAWGTESSLESGNNL